MLELAFVAWTFCSCLFTYTHGWSFPQGLAGELAQQLHVPTIELLEAASTWQNDFLIKRELQGSGFHRSLNIKIAKAPNSNLLLSRCQLLLLQPLPSSIFADPYQLEDLTRSSRSSSHGQPAASTEGYAYTFRLLGPLDLELPAPACQTNALLLEFTLAQPSVLLSVPLHAKYPEPHAFKFTGWQALMTGQVQAVVPLPWLLVDCRAAGGKVQVLKPPQQQQQQQPSAEQEQQQQCGAEGVCHAGSDQQQEQQQVLWSVPAGNLDHLQLVSWATLLITAACCTALSIRAVQVSLSSGQLF